MTKTTTPVEKGHLNTKLPPTEDDRKMSVRHHADSVAYNLRHSDDHFKATADHIKRMQEVAGDDAAAALAKKAARMLEQMQREIAPYLATKKREKK